MLLSSLYEFKGNIAVEGLSCVGKTSLLRKMLEFGFVCVDEWLLKAEATSSRTHLFTLNDRKKAECLMNNSRVVLDRYYISTALCDVVCRGKQDLYAAIDSYSINYTQPDLWIYIKSNPHESYERAIANRDMNNYSPWFDYQKIKLLSNGYDEIFSSLDNVLTVDSDDLQVYLFS
ncbi:hypothetical protein AB6D60_22450 [Vibrio splendidus]